MADDIDIVEHDVLDQIKSIFPDLTTIKTEVDDYEEEESEVIEEASHSNACSIFPVEFEEDIDFLTFQNKIILGTKPSQSPSASQSPVFQNKIILGSKSHTPDSLEESEAGVENYDLPEAAVVLTDCNDILANSPCYCQLCETLFPTENAFDSHKMTAHSFLVAVSKNKAVKSTAKSSLPKIKLEPEDVTERQNLVCNHCDEIFPNEIALIKHSYELLPGKFQNDKCKLVFEDDPEYQRGPQKPTHAKTDTYVICRICTCHFKWKAKLLNHLWTNHQTKDAGPLKHVATHNSYLICNLCGFKVKYSKYYNVHILSHHAQLYTKTAIEAERISKFKCPQCSLSFSSQYSVRIHLAAKHGRVVEPKAPAKLPSVSVPTSKVGTQNLVFGKCRPVPKSTLYKCSKCATHFLSCLAALQHWRRCDSKKGDFRCLHCRRIFKLSDRAYHIHQHGVTHKFKIIDVTNHLLSKVLCRCNKCMVCFDEKSLLTYHSDSCYAESPSVQCKDCQFWIHSNAMTTHKKLHADGFTLADFIVTDYIHVGSPSNKELPQVTEISKPPQLIYYFCPTCKCFMQRNRHVDKHYIGKCKRNIPAITCKLCGLRFTAKGLASHKRKHKNFPKLKLRDLKFVNIMSDESIDPPFPDFKKCHRCKVRFFGTVALNNHVCNSEEPKVCTYCGESFSDLAYNLHVPFHEYAGKPKTVANENVPELIKKYESLKQVWNILFLCQTCNIVIDTYDKVVVHCQDHFCNMESYNVTIVHCKICDLNFVEDCYRRHQDLHISGDINRSSFTILEYKFDTLLSDAWLDIFVTLTKEQVDLILSKSIYKLTRSVRMEKITDGPSELTLYRCSVCELMVPANKVIEHSQNQGTRCLESPKKFDCSICKLQFSTKNLKVAHENLHEGRRLDDRSFRIIQFFADEQFGGIDDGQTRANAEPEGLKFIRCQHCGKLINKQKYKKHATYHIYYNRNKVKGSTKVFTKLKPNPMPKIVHMFYRCKECNLCVSRKNIKTHSCLADIVRKKCFKCSLWFRAQNLTMHHKYHDRYKFNRKNMTVMYFENGVIEDKKHTQKPPPETKILKSKERTNECKVTYYQCANCSLCIIKKVNIRRHTCSAVASRVQCSLCHLVFRPTRIAKHNQLHQHKKITSKNINVIKFKNGKELNPVAEKRKRPPSPAPETAAAKKLKLRADMTVAPHKLNYELTDKEFLKYMYIRYYKCTKCQLMFLTGSALVAHDDACPDGLKGVKCQKCGLVFHASMIELHRKLHKCKVKRSKRICLLTLQAKGVTQYKPNNWIYMCRQCRIYNISFRGMYNHLTNLHKYTRKMKKCVKCNIRMSSSSYIWHKKQQHGKVEVHMSDLNIAIVDDTTLEAIVNDSPKDYKPMPSLDTRPADANEELCDSELTNEDEEDATNTGIHNCDVCGLNFINVNSLKSHKARKRHDEIQYSCQECGLSFTQASLKRHTVLHHKAHKRRKLNDPQDPNESGTFKGEPNESTVESVSNVFDERRPIAAVSRGSVASEETNKNELCKCSECDVYFLTADACRDHTDQHTALDPTEYIACKMCDLQFPCEYLGKHMKGHRDKTFSIDDLIVAEYQPGGGGVRVDTYLAVDRLKSKLVSTTTHSDTEDGQSVSCVDSTTENVIEFNNVTSVNNASLESALT